MVNIVRISKQMFFDKYQKIAVYQETFLNIPISVLSKFDPKQIPVSIYS